MNDSLRGCVGLHCGGWHRSALRDHASRLIHEVRNDVFSSTDYDWSYAYDPGGNRTLKVENVSPLLRFEDRYEYDLDDQPRYETKANRLMTVERWRVDISFGESASFEDSTLSGGDPALPGGGPMAAGGPGGGPTEIETLISTQYYFYDRFVTEDHGNVHRVVTEIENPGPTEKKYSATRFEYALNGRAVTFALGEEWDWSGIGCPTDYDITFAREFRYDGARQRWSLSGSVLRVQRVRAYDQTPCLHGRDGRRFPNARVRLCVRSGKRQLDADRPGRRGNAVPVRRGQSTNPRASRAGR